jgi:isocitrate dehydrogenase (NAD+)
MTRTSHHSVARVTLIPGDGIGPEVTAATVKLLEAAGAAVEWEEIRARPTVGRRKEDSQADPLVDSIQRNGVGLKGPLTTPVGGGQQSINVALRKALDLYANFRPIRSLPGVRTPFQSLDLIVVRENTEDLYAGLEHEVIPGVVESLKIITERASTRIARFAFEHARNSGRKSIAAVHKANIMKLSDGLFLECIRKVARDYPEISCREVIVDNCCMQLVMRPQQFDVLLLENLYGDIISDLCAGLVGGLGLVPGANLGERCAIFEAVHGSAPDIAGKGWANPTALMLSSILMLRHLHQDATAARIENALHRVYQEGKRLTRDVGGNTSTGEFTASVIGALEQPVVSRDATE